MTKPPLYVPIAVLIAVTVGIASTNVPQEPSTATKDHDKTMTAPQATAKRLYLRDCAMCHGENGKGQTDLARDMQLQLSDLTDSKTLSDKQDEELFKLIRNGKDKMPPEAEERAKDDEVRSLIQYVRSFSNSETTTSNPNNSN
jgi:mono/diheme cytochrome c family protein